VTTGSPLPVAVLALATVCWAASPGWESVSPGVAVELPRDLAAHPSVQTEWWYATGLLTDSSGHRYGVQWTLFRRGLDPAQPAPGDSGLRARHALSGHLAVADLGTGSFRSGERVRRAAAGLAGWDGEGNVWLEDWTFEARPDRDMRIRASVVESGLGLDLTLRPTRPPVLQGERGYSRKGPETGNASAYLSLTRCAAAGTLTVDDTARSVSGTLWFDREWGTTQLPADTVGWDWFGLRLSDGRDLTVYRLRRSDGSTSPFSSGTLALADGTAMKLGPGELILEPERFWSSRESGARYPIRWRLRVPAAGVDLEVRAPVEGCEVDGLRSTGTLYWEGPVEVSGGAHGDGYMELTGYAPSSSARGG
jgi:predicted secreted hydrolase